MIRVMEKEMPSKIKGFVVKCFDDCDYFTIFVNAFLSDEIKREVIKHEMEHIERGDFDSFAPVNIVEKVRHNEENR